jgi:hypothetical protein
VPQRATPEAYVEGCGGGQDAVRAADALWRQARIEERGRLTQTHAPRSELIVDAADLSRALEAVWERAGAPSLRQIRDRSGNPLALPVSSAARIVKRDTVPADEQQLRAFLTGCGIPPEQHAVWTAAFAKVSSASVAATAAMTPAGEWNVLKRQAAMRRLLRLTASGQPTAQQGLAPRAGDQQWRQFLSLLPPATIEEIVASGVHSYLASEAARNGKNAHLPKPSRPDMLVAHDGKYMVVDFKSASRQDGGPQASGGSTRAPRTPPGGGTPSPPGAGGGRAAQKPVKDVGVTALVAAAKAACRHALAPVAVAGRAGQHRKAEVEKWCTSPAQLIAAAVPAGSSASLPCQGRLHRR